MCGYCQKKEQLMCRDIATECWGNFSGYEEIQVIIDRGYLRLGYSDDMQCLDHGENIKINYCTICGNGL